ncbi:MAG TPA: ABC transporter substrate-binding protein [Caldimonas sp.]|nr:ABC transporter substrate-binding protein [Caldimonas sp.]HEX2540345.1 ABC transporter substrate-binding protein [Caldimonas sp.]
MSYGNTMTRPGLRAILAAAALALSAGAAHSPAQAQPAQKAIFWGLGGDIDFMDIHRASSAASWRYLELAYEPLLTVDSDAKLQPLLAESWRQTSPTTYEFTIRQGAKFSNGRPVVADDVVGSFARLSGQEMNPAGVAAATTDEDKKKASNKITSYWAKQLGDFKSLVAVNDRTVRIELAQPNAAFLGAVAHINSSIIPMKEFRDGSFDPMKRFLGTGPFMLSVHKPKESWVFTRNPHYWRAGYPKADVLNVAIIPDEAARLAALRDGRIDFAGFTNPDINRLTHGDSRLVVTPQQTPNFYRLDINALGEKSAFRDKRLRQALNLAIDRDAIAKIVFAGYSRPEYPIPAVFGKSACRDLDSYKLPRPERLKKARELMAAAGKTRVDFELMTNPGDPAYSKMAQLMQQNLREVGMHARIQQVAVPDFIDRVWTKNQFEVVTSWMAGFTDPGMVPLWWNPKTAVWNRMYFEDVPAMNAALDKLTAAPIGPQRDAALVEACRLIDDGANLLALVTRVDFIVHRPDLIDIKLDRVVPASNYNHMQEFATKRSQ